VCTVGAVSKARLSMKKSSFEYEKGQFEYEKGRPKTDPPFFIDLGGLPWCMIPRWKDLAISNTMVVFNLHKYAFKVTISFEYEKVLCFSLGSKGVGPTPNTLRCEGRLNGVYPPRSV
jgi:hypothetical protein